MASVLVCGGGPVGLCAAMMIAREGHEVTVLEADPAGVPGTAEEAWTSWDRRGVAQFRQPHNLFSRRRRVLDLELPGLTQRLLDAGCTWVDVLRPMPPTVSDQGERPGDDVFRFVTGRRPVVEAALAGAADDAEGVSVRRGVKIGGLLARPGDVPHVTGVRTAGGEELHADLVVDATGRRSRTGAWLEGIGARPPEAHSEDSGFVYYTRYFRGPERPQTRAPGLCAMGSISVLTLAGDNDTWSVTLFGPTCDAALRSLRRPEVFTRVVAACPAHAHWLAGTPVGEVRAMAGIVDRYRRFIVDGRPVATGYAAVGDAWACTNPSAGRGLSVGLLHAQRLRGVVREHLGDPTHVRGGLGPGDRGPRGAVLPEPDRRRPGPVRRDGGGPHRGRAAGPGRGDDPVPDGRRPRR